MRLTIAELRVGQGVFGISPCPGRAGFYAADLIAIQHWQPALVVSFLTAEELSRTAHCALPWRRAVAIRHPICAFAHRRLRHSKRRLGRNLGPRPRRTGKGP